MAAENFQPNAGIIHDEGCEISVPRDNLLKFLPFTDSFKIYK